MNRRQSIATLGGLTSLLLAGPLQAKEGGNTDMAVRKKFTYCLNTSTISGCGDYSVVDYINIAGEAGYDGVELWIGDIRKYLEQGGIKDDITNALKKYKLTFENTIGFAPWLSGPQGLEKMRSDMELLASLGAKRIAAPPVGHSGEAPLDLFQVGEQYKKLLVIGRQTGVMPQLEFWGASDIFWHLGQAMMVLTATAEKDARLLPDIYHLFRGGSDFEALPLLNPAFIEVFHMNDYPGDKARLEQNDADRVFPGDGVGPIREVLNYLSGAPGKKVLSLELFNRNYWNRPALEVAEEGLEKMKKVAKK
jgi:sugar phosphate isomerase/epimerase